MRPEALTSARWGELCDREKAVPAAVHEAVDAILADVETRKDAALREWTEKLDGCDLEDPWLPQEAWNAACARVPSDLQEAIRDNLGRIRAFHEASTAQGHVMETAPGLSLGRIAVPLPRAACYVPGGRAAYPSTVLMTVAPAAIAGVADIIVVTPPDKDGHVPDAVCFAAREAGAHRILRAGGAQAVAAVGHGTARVPRVSVLVGPGNAYVTAAKQKVAGLRTDFPAGPSELLVIADRTSNPHHVALDLAAQAEHDPDAQVVLVATDAGTAEDVCAALDALVPSMERAAIVAASLQHAACFVAPLDDAIAFANDYAPEHLSLAVANPRDVLPRITNAGSVFLGSTPVSLGDYGSGTNHVLPTMGHARLHGGLGVDHFRRWMTWQEATPEGLAHVAPSITRLAAEEGLHGHAAAVTGRLS